MTTALPYSPHYHLTTDAEPANPPAPFVAAGSGLAAATAPLPANGRCLAPRASNGTVLVRKSLRLAAFLYAALISPTSAAIITFDDLYVSGGIPVSNPYNGLLWTNFYPAATNWFNGPNGFVNACISGEAFASNGGGGPASIGSGVFNLNGGHFAAGWNDNLQLEVQGLLKGSLLYSSTYTLSATSGTKLTFNYQGVDTVVFSASSGTPHPGYSGEGTFFAVDDLDVAVTADALINSQPSGLSAVAGDSASFSVSAYGAPPFAYQWLFNGAPISSATNTTLTLTNVQAWNQGEYSVVVYGHYNSVTSSNAALTVTPTRPRFTEQPAIHVETSTFDVSMSASVVGSLPISYQWHFNGKNIDGATNSSFALKHPQTSNDGYYSLVASNAYGEATSSNAMLVCSLLSAVVGWGYTNDSYGAYAGQTTPPDDLAYAVAIAAGGSHNLALNRDGTVAGWGDDLNGVSSYTSNLFNVISIAAGWQHSVALRNDGSVISWGGNSVGQTNVPIGLSNVVAIAAGGCDCGPDPSSTLALKNDGTVVGWGGTLVPAGLSNIVAVAAGATRDLALTDDGKLIAWENVSLMGPPDGKAIVVTNGMTNVVAIACGQSHALALQLDGTVYAWGANSYGQTNVPPGLSNVVSISAGGNFNLALQGNGRVVGWGENYFGQTAVPPSLSNVVAIAAGRDHSLALVNNGAPVIVRQPMSRTVYSGSTVKLSAGAVGPAPMNLQWQLHGTNVPGATNSWLVLIDVQPNAAGNYALTANHPNTGTAVSSNAVLSVITSPPILISQPSNTMTLSGGAAGFEVSVVGSLPFTYQWQLNGTNIAGATNATLTLTNLAWTSDGAYTVVVSNAYGVVTSSNALLTLRRSQVVGWGSNYYGPTNVPPDLTNAVGIAAGFGNGLALKADGTAVGWGYNGMKQTTPPEGLSNVVAIATGGGFAYGFTLALKSDGTVAGWGNNAAKQSSPPGGLSNVVAIAAGQIHSLALRNDGKMIAWGGNSYGQTNIPATLTNVIGLSAGLNFSMALNDTGIPTAWGDNSYGQTNIPPGLSNVTAIACGWYHCLALKDDGTIWAWGNNDYRQATVPVDLRNVIGVAAGQYHSLAIKGDGTVVAWGRNSYKQSSVPSGLNRVVSVSAGADHSLALMEDGPPVIFAQPESQTNYAGLTAVLTVNVSGLHPLHFQWLFNGSNIASATNATFTLTKLHPGMAGVYTLVCSNALGSAASSAAVIGVITNAPFLTLQPTNRAVMAGSDVTFGVAVGAGPMPNSYQWQFNSADIPGATNLVLTLTNVQPTNEGNYAVRVTNGYGTVTSSNAYLSVLLVDLPTALNTPGLTWTTGGSAAWFAQTSTSHDGIEAAQSGTVANGQSSDLQTTVTGPGTLSYWWRFSTAFPFRNTLSFFSSQGNNSASVISTSGWEQRTFYLGAGGQTLTWNYLRYAFLSAHSTGWVDQVSFVPGGTAPTVTSVSPAAYVRVNSNAVFTVSAFGTPPLSYQWQLNGTNLPDATNAFLNLTGVQSTNVGIYTVAITNSFGSITTNTALWVGQFGFSGSPTNMFSSSNGFQLQLDGVLTTNPVVIFGSTDLVSWLPLFTNSAATGSVQFRDGAATNLPARFYRALE